MLFKTVVLPDDLLECSSLIDGLGFCANEVQHDTAAHGQCGARVLSNTGDIVGHFVTHSPDFAYTTFGIHVGQVDRLTFHAARQRSIEGYFIDCRKGAPTCGEHVHILFSSGVQRKLVIPCGVAHAFSNLGEVVTRNDLSLYAAEGNAAWNVLNDDIVFDWTPEGICSAPRVAVNKVPIPLEVNRLFYRIQQDALRAIPMGAKQEGSAGVEHAKVRTLKAAQWETCISGCEWDTNCFDEVASRSWMILPGTSLCEMAMVLLQLDGTRTHRYALSRDRDVLLTFLDREGVVVEVDLIDLRLDSATYDRRSLTRWICDPRFFLRIPAGVAYRPVGTGMFALREEFEPSGTGGDRIAHLADVESTSAS